MLRPAPLSPEYNDRIQIACYDQFSVFASPHTIWKCRLLFAAGRKRDVSRELDSLSSYQSVLEPTFSYAFRNS